MRISALFTLTPLFLFAPALALAQTDTSTGAASLEDLLGTVVESAGNGAWGIFAGALIMLLVALANKFGLLDALPKAAKRWVALGVSVLGAVGTGLLAGAAWTQILTAALTTGVAAVGSWEFFKNKLGPATKSKKQKQEDGEA